jgi:hypothetical protein
MLSRELGYNLFPFDKEDFDNNPFLEKELRNIFKIINKEKNKQSIYDLKFYYLFFYNLYLEKKVILPLFYLNDINIEEEEEEEEEDEHNDENQQDNNKKIALVFNSLYNKYIIEVFNDNKINLEYNNYIYNFKNSEILIDDSIERKIKNQVIFNNLIKQYLKCNKITFLIITKLL